MPHDDIRHLLQRRDLAATRYRAAVSRQLGLGDSEMLAVAHLAQRGRLTPGELGHLLDLSSGGVSALVQRLEEHGHIVREPHPTDGRSNVVRLSPPMIERTGHALSPLVTDLDRVIETFDDEQRRAIVAFLTRAAELSEQHADRAYAQLSGGARPAPTTPVPSLWG
ncbi:MAG TPA: MarR family transcriptional regulator [Solirubrobacter sp.]|nr:MarR family transcriptional regulator [Solirubrobacter sp.]